jgi:hypothetical protein
LIGTIDTVMPFSAKKIRTRRELGEDFDSYNLMVFDNRLFVFRVYNGLTVPLNVVVNVVSKVVMTILRHLHIPPAPVQYQTNRRV